MRSYRRLSCYMDLREARLLGRKSSKLFKGKFRTVAIDLTGHGKTAVPEDIARYSMEQQVEDLEALFDMLSLDRFTLVGYSMGGRIALAYTVQYPERFRR